MTELETAVQGISVLATSAPALAVWYDAHPGLWAAAIMGAGAINITLVTHHKPALDLFVFSKRPKTRRPVWWAVVNAVVWTAFGAVIAVQHLRPTEFHQAFVAGLGWTSLVTGLVTNGEKILKAKRARQRPKRPKRPKPKPAPPRQKSKK